MAKVALVLDNDALACQAARILQAEGAKVETVPCLPQRLENGHIVVTSQQLPSRFPSAHLRILGNTVYVRENPTKNSQNPNGFQVAVLEMGRKLELLPPRAPEKRSRKRNRGENRWERRRTTRLW